MSLADELLDSLDEDQVATHNIDPSIEPHIIINEDKTIIVPDELKHIAVEGEHNIETVTFDCPRYWDEHDLSEMSMRINYQRPDGHREPHPVENLMVDDANPDMIHFDWTISGNVTAVKGTISFMVCAKLTDEKGIIEREWHSRLNQDLVIDAGLDCSGREIVERNPDVLESILFRLETIESTGGNSSDSSQNIDLTGYATEQYVQNYAQPVGKYLTEETDPTVPSWAKQPNKPSYTAAEVGARPNTWMPTAKDIGALPSSYVPPDQTPEQVGADPAGTAEHTVDVHNTSTTSHNDIRLLIEGLTTRLNALANSTDTDLDQMAELVAYIKSNKSLIDGITTNKVNVVDIINNLTTNVTNKPLSAAQGVALKALIDELSASLANYQPKGNYALVSAVPTKVSQLTNDKGYLTQHQDISGKLDADKLPAAINTALAQAKVSGEFDGVDGKDGKDGKDGLDATPVTPLFANSIEECTDTTKLYVLPDGFIYAYMMAEVPGTVEKDGFDSAVESDGTPFNGGQGWKDGYRVNSSGVEGEYDGMSVTGFIPIKMGDVVTIENASNGSNTSYLHFYNTSFSRVAGGSASDFAESGTVPNITFTVATENAAYFRYTARFYEGASGKSDTIITVTTTGGTSKEYRWVTTGHAFVPADYEGRIIAVEEAAAENESRIANLENRSADDVPSYVVAEAEEVIGKVISAQGNRTFTFAAITDMHYGNGGYTDGLINACQAMKYIDERIKLDAVAALGDYTDGFTATNYDNAIGDFKAINAEMNNLRFAPNLRLRGNHDYYDTKSILHRFITAYSDDVVWGSKLGGYFYRDFEDFKLRIICLNTAEENKDGLSCSAEQYNWFAGVLDLSGKGNAAEWQTLILSHHPLDWFISNDGGYVFWQILRAYLGGTSWNGCNFAGKNAAKIVGNIHGHMHNLLVRNIAAGQPNTTANTVNVVRIATPEACYGRSNSYHGAWDYNPFGEDTSYPKTPGTAEDTAFCIYCIDLDAYTIKAICYGAGYDREINY